jgi:hypothetical protein
MVMIIMIMKGRLNDEVEWELSGKSECENGQSDKKPSNFERMNMLMKHESEMNWSEVKWNEMKIFDGKGLILSEADSLHGERKAKQSKANKVKSSKVR